jgi:GAF domain-containing protein
VSESSTQPYAGALEALHRILNREPEPDEVLRQAIAAIHERIPRFTWVGLYLVEGEELVLGPWAGTEPAARTRLPATEGAIGRAVAWHRTEVVDDVIAVEGHPSCFPWTRSEIDVPVVYEGTAIGVIGIDSDQPHAFGPEDARFLERVALLLSAHCLVGWDTGGVPWSDVR